MKSWLPAAGLAIALPLALACSSDSNATPVSPEIVGLEAATAEVAEKMQVCHIKKKHPGDADSSWTFKIVNVSSRSMYHHLWHGDVRNECSNAMAAGDDCYSCAVR